MTFPIIILMKRMLHYRAWRSLVLLMASTACGATAKPPAASALLPHLDSIIQDAIQTRQIPGAVVIVGHHGHVIYRKAFGHRALDPKPEPMTIGTVFDLASLTKVVATTTAVMQLFEQGRFRLNDPVAKYLPEFAQNGKQDITIRQLLIHYSGLAPDLDLQPSWQGKETAFRLAFAGVPTEPPGSRFVYSDINFIVLGALVERLSGQSLHRYAEEHIFAPLKMSHTRFLPPASWQANIAPTEPDEQHNMLRGVVHDPTTRRMGGVAGHAGLFSTADDLAIFAQALLNRGRGILSPFSVEKMTTPEQPPTSTVVRGFGWDLDSPFSTNRGELLPIGSYGHTGFTGTSLWIDPTTETYIILLTNAIHMGEPGTAISLRTRLATAVAADLKLTTREAEKLRASRLSGYNEAESAARRMAVRNGLVKTGIDVLEAHNFADLKLPAGPTRVGLLTNQTGIDSQGQRTIDILAHAPGISLQAIFSPEHGVAGSLDTTEILNSKDAATGVPIYSLYGATEAARRPSANQLNQLDAVVVDLQDAGARFYTYLATTGYFLEAAAKAGVRVVILDRPNPITGSVVQGPVSDPGHESFVNYFPLPVRHGMTLGELATMFNSERGIHARLEVIRMEGWQRGDWYDSTGLAWINPSPNLRNVGEAALYPGIALLEATNISVGRGTDTPFEILGAPWIKGRELARYLNQRGIASVRFIPVSFTPSSSIYAGAKCEGVNILMLDRNTLDAPELGIELAAALGKLHPEDFHLDGVQTLLVNQTVFDALGSGQDPRRISQDWQEQLWKFQTIREKYLLYK